MFGDGPATRVYLAARATDMRKDFEGLYGLVRDTTVCSYCSGMGAESGSALCAKRLEKGWL